MDDTKEQISRYALVGARAVVEKIFALFPALRTEFLVRAQAAGISKKLTYADVGAVGFGSDRPLRVARKKAGKPHWTQTPAGRAKMAKLQRASWKARRAVKKPVVRKSTAAAKKAAKSAVAK